MTDKNLTPDFTSPEEAEVIRKIWNDSAPYMTKNITEKQLSVMHSLFGRALNRINHLQKEKAKPFKLVPRTLAKQLDHLADKLSAEERDLDHWIVAASLRSISTQVDAIERAIEALSKLAQRG